MPTFDEDKGAWAAAAAIADIAVPGSATAADCANKINAILAALRTAGILATD
jgi:hypothetical protein